jgi:hypothetical protein
MRFKYPGLIWIVFYDSSRSSSSRWGQYEESTAEWFNAFISVYLTARIYDSWAHKLKKSRRPIVNHYTLCSYHSCYLPIRTTSYYFCFLPCIFVCVSATSQVSNYTSTTTKSCLCYKSDRTSIYKAKNIKFRELRKSKQAKRRENYSLK